MITTNEIKYNIEFQNQIHYCYFDYEKNERIITSFQEADGKEVKYIYSENDEIYIEYDNEN